MVREGKRDMRGTITVPDMLYTIYLCFLATFRKAFILTLKQVHNMMTSSDQHPPFFPEFSAILLPFGTAL